MASSDVARALKKLVPVLIEAQERNLNEADTRLRVVRLLSDVLGYDELNELSSEQRVRQRFVDYAVEIDGVVRFLIEVKSAKTTLRDRHIEQAERYASQGNIPWVVLTNGIVWNLYHLTFDEGIDYDLAFSVNLSSDRIDEAAALLGVLHRSSVLRGEHERFWSQQLALSPYSLGRALFTDDVMRAIRKAVRANEGFLIDPEDLAKALHELFTPEAREQMGPVKIRRSKKRKPRARHSKSSRKPEPQSQTLDSSAGQEQAEQEHGLAPVEVAQADDPDNFQ